jgi:small subunit ribosomal protein S21
MPGPNDAPRILKGHPLQVLVRDNNVDQALRVLKKKMQREGIFREMKARKSYEKPSERKTREKAEAVRRNRKLARKQAIREGLIAAPKPKPRFAAPRGRRGEGLAEARQHRRRMMDPAPLTAFAPIGSGPIVRPPGRTCQERSAFERSFLFSTTIHFKKSFRRAAHPLNSVRHSADRLDRALRPCLGRPVVDRLS